MSGTGGFAHLLGVLLANTTATIAQTTQAPDAERVMGVGGWALEQFAEDLVVPVDRELEAFLDQRLFGTGLVPPGPLELEDRLVTFGEVCSGEFHHL